jgi:hypothetical protein
MEPRNESRDLLHLEASSPPKTEADADIKWALALAGILAHILAQGDTTAWLMMQSSANQSPQNREINREFSLNLGPLLRFWRSMHE